MPTPSLFSITLPPFSSSKLPVSFPLSIICVQFLARTPYPPTRRRILPTCCLPFLQSPTQLRTVSFVTLPVSIRCSTHHEIVYAMSFSRVCGGCSLCLLGGAHDLNRGLFSVSVGRPV